MKFIISKYLVVSVLALLTWTSSSFASSDLSVDKKQTDKADKEEKIEIVPVVKLDSESSTPSNSKLKQGKACDFDNLEEAEGELIVDIPMAKTEPCDKVGCKNLKPAKMLDDNYVELKTAKTINCDKDNKKDKDK